MRNTTIASASGYGKNLKRWRSGLMALFALLCVTAGYSQTGTIGIGSGTGTNVYMPVRAYYGYTYSQQIVTSAEYSAGGGVAGQITKIRYYISNASTPLANWNNWTVYIGHTSKTAFSSNTDWEPVANLTQVFTGTVTQASNTWMEITLTTPFTYDGTSNLIVAVDENAASYSDSDVNFGSYTSAANTGIYYYNDNTNPVPATPPSGTRTGTLARIQFDGAVASCLAPTAVSAIATSANAANITWTASASTPANGYQYYYSTSSAAPASSATPSGSVAAGVTTAGLTGLTSNTTYYVYARSVCSGSDSSNWSSVSSFATPCDPVGVPYLQDFESVTPPALPECTTIQNAGTANNWATAASPGANGFTSKVLRYAYGSATANAWFYTRGITLTAGTSYRITYKYGNNSTFYGEKLKVAYGTANVNTAMTNVLADHPNINTAIATTNYVDFVPATSGVYYFGFQCYSPAYYYYLYVDDINVTLTPTCIAPLTVAGTVVTTTSGTINWTAPASAPALGYEYYYATTQATPLDTTTPSGSVAAGVLTASVTGLTPSTTYYVWVRSVCTTSDKSSWAGYGSFYTNYCTPAPASQDNSGITNVTIGSINNTTGSETGYYGNYSAQTASFALGSTANFSVTYTTGYTYGTKIWVDWNDDLDFDDAGEQMYYGLSTNASPTTLSGSFNIPTTVAVGNHRMRIGGTDNDLGGTPCYTGSYGTYEDYTLNVFMPPAPVITGFTPASYCAATGVITITGTDLGNATLAIGGTAVTPLTTNTATQIVATVPAGVSGTVAVTTVAGTATSATTFNVSAPATFTLSDDAETICNGAATAAVTITEGAASFDTYVWAPATGVSGSAAAGWTFNPTATTEYVLTASQSAGPCVVNATFNVTVNPLPNAVVVSPATVDACINQPVTLTATGGESLTPVPYCSPTVTSTGATGDYLNNFSFANITNNNSGDATSDYTYYSALTANVTGGGSYTISLQTGSTLYFQGLRVWIDYNQDGVFADNESVFSSTATVTSATTVTGSIIIPATATNGVTRMRVLCSYNALSAVTNDCSWTGYGEYEDYKVNITGATNPVDYVWAPATGLYTDAAATVPYVAGASAQVVYAKPTATATYSASASTPLGCSISGSSTLTVYNTPAPTAVSPQAFTVMTYPANLAATGTNIQWYTSATGGTPLTATTEIWTGTYYASQTLNGCESQTRAAVEVSVILPELDWVNLQWPPALTVAQGTTGEVFAQGFEPGVTPGAGPGIGVQAWIGVSSSNTNPSAWTTWIPMTYNTQVGNNDEFVAAIGAGLAPGTYYYASRFKLLDGPYKYGGYSADGGSFWNGTSYVSGVLTVTCGTAAPVAAASQTFCNNATVAGLQATGTTVQWYAAATGGTALSNNTALVSGTTYYASQTIGCESITRTAVTVTITTTPAPTGDATQEFTVEGWVSGLEATGTGIQWYAAATGGTPLAGTTALVTGTTYYASQTVNGCESATRFAVTVSLVAYTLDFVNLQWPAEISIVEGSDATIYAQVYEANVTPGAGPGVGVTVMIGISTENTDPSTWTTWIPMTFNTQVGNNDEWMALIGANLEPGTYYYAVSGMLYDGPYTYGGYSATGGGTWNGTTNVSGVITVVCYTAAPWAAAGQQVFCNGATVASLSASGSEIQWYASETGGEALAADTAIADGTVYYGSQTVNGCQSMGRVAVTAYINVIAAPTGEAIQTVTYTAVSAATIDGIVVESEGTVVWYATEADALAGANPIAPGTVIESGTYYGVTTVGECTSATAFAVTVDVVLGDGRFDMASFSYYPNPVSDMLTISYSEEITSVTVFNLLGQKVVNIAPNANEVKLDMTALAEGAYIVNVAVGNTVKTIKVVKKQ